MGDFRTIFSRKLSAQKKETNVLIVKTSMGFFLIFKPLILKSLLLMKKFLLLTLSLIYLTVFSQQSLIHTAASRTIEYDEYGRIIKDAAGNKINFQVPYNTQSSPTTSGNSQLKGALPGITAQELLNCGPAWNYTIMGTNLGERSMKTLDLDHNGKVETVLGARMGNGSAWYVLSYDSAAGYIKSFVSDFYLSRTITCMQYYDTNNDSIFEVFVGFDNGDVKVFDGGTKQQITQFTLAGGLNYVRAIEMGDIDNNGTIEMVISSDYTIFFYHLNNFTLINQITGGAFDLKIGNVDSDPINEIVTSKGDVLQFNGTSAPVQWHFNSSTYSYEFIELSDIDLDGKKEIIKVNGWDSISVYDADIQQRKFMIPTNNDIDAILLADLNNDNIDEIIYGDGQWGDIHCINATTHAQMWTLNNTGHGVSALSIGDTDADGTKELFYGNGASSSSGDTLYVHNASNLAKEWNSKCIDGPYYAMDIDDIDNDGTKEIVAISYESSSGYKSGVLSIFDATTHALEWESNGVFFNSVWTGIFDLEISDIDNDGDKEIIVAAGVTYTGKIWIVDGTSKVIQSSHLYQTENLDEFYSISIDDVDHDGNLEIVAVGDEVYFINPSNFTLEWTSPTYSGNNSRICRTGNIDADTAVEVLICAGSGFGGNQIVVYDGISHVKTQTISSSYRCFDLMDMNGDGIDDIIAGTNTGTIDILNGPNLQVISTRLVSSAPIDGIEVSSIDGDSIPEIIFGSQGKLFFLSSQGKISYTPGVYGSIAGTPNALKAIDVNNDGEKEIFFGTSMAIVELEDECTNCISFAANINKQNLLCSAPNSGTIHVAASGGQFPVSYYWSNGSTDSTLTGLGVGNYYLTITDAGGCILKDTVSILQSQLIGNVLTTNVSCNGINLGSANVNINIGTPPYTYNWSNGTSAPSANNLTPGNYSVTVTDSSNCSATLPFSISKDSLVTFYQKFNPNCNGINNGMISVYATGGTSPYSISWSNGQNYWNLYGLGSGNYIYQVTDAAGCESVDTVVIQAPTNSITLYISTFPDNPATPIADGGATVSATGGTPPYTIQWNDPFMQTTPTVNNLAPGTYTVTVRDQLGCIAQSILQIWVIGIKENLSIESISLRPNPAKDELNLNYELKEAPDLRFEIRDISGRIIKTIQLDPLENVKIIQVSDLSPGLYFYSIFTGQEVLVTNKLIIAQ